MNRYKKKTLLACAFLTALNIAACRQVKEDELVNREDFTVSQQESDTQVDESTDSEDKRDETVNAEAGIKYTLNGNIISDDEYTELCSKIFAAEVSTN